MPTTPFGCGITRFDPVANKIDTWRRCGFIHLRSFFRVWRMPSTDVKISSSFDSSGQRHPKSVLIASAIASTFWTRMRSSLSRFCRRSS